MKPKIDIYYCRICGACDKAIQFLHHKGLDFNAYAIEYDEAADKFIDSENTREMFMRCGEEIDFVPQIFVNNHHIAGWMKLKPMTENGEFDRLLSQA